MACFLSKCRSHKKKRLINFALISLLFIAAHCFVTLGKIFLKAVIDGRPLPDTFSPSLFKFLLGIPPNLQDLESYLHIYDV